MMTTTELSAAFAAAPTGVYNRGIERTVTLHEAPDGGKTSAVLSTRHDKDRKQFSASVRIVRIDPPSNGFACSTWIPFERTHNRRLPSIPVGRYSNKALEKADADTLALLADEPDWLDQLDLGPYQGSL